MLHYATFGTATQAPPLVIVHGLFGSGRNWGVIAKRLSDRGLTVTPDMRNHGASARTATHSYADLADDLSALIQEIGAPVDLCGHSMGGKAAMMTALRAPELINKLVIADIAPVRYQNSQQVFIDAMRRVDLQTLTRRSDASQTLGAAGVEPALQSFFTQSLNVAEKRWLLNLDTLEAEMEQITGWPADVTGQFAGPTLMLSGGASDYVLPEYRPQIRTLFPKARFAKIPGAGHWLHAENPRAFEASLRVFLDS